MAIIDQGEDEIKRENIVGDKLLVRDASYAVLERRGLPIELDQVITVAGSFSLPSLNAQGQMLIQCLKYNCR